MNTLAQAMANAATEAAADEIQRHLRQDRAADDFNDDIVNAMEVSGTEFPIAQVPPQPPTPAPDVSDLVQRTREKFQRDLDGCIKAKSALERAVGELEKEHRMALENLEADHDRTIAVAEQKFMEGRAALETQLQMTMAKTLNDLAQVTIARDALEAAVSRLNQADV